MRPQRHWTPRYVADRLLVAAHAKRHPDAPWWTRAATEIVEDLLRSTDDCFEWGSGRSTLWLAERTRSVRSVEHDRGWYERMAPELARTSSATVTLVDAAPEPYATAIGDTETFDLIVVDGLFRDRCASLAVDRLRPAGILLLDNSERYLPNDSRSPQSIGATFENDGWRTFATRVEGWRTIVTSDGISDTSFFLKP